MLTRWRSQPIRRRTRSSKLIQIIISHSITAPKIITAINGIVSIVICTPAFCVSSHSIIVYVLQKKNSLLYCKINFINIFGIGCLLVKTEREISRDWLPGECLKTLRLTWIATMIYPLEGPLISLKSFKIRRITFYWLTWNLWYKSERSITLHRNHNLHVWTLKSEKVGKGSTLNMNKPRAVFCLSDILDRNRLKGYQ